MIRSGNKVYQSMCRRISLLPLTLTLLLATGCGVSDLSGPSADPATDGAPFSGMLHGGQNPIIGATIKLWSVGATGYGSAATLLATSTTDSTGSFAFQNGGATNYTCTGTPLLYLTAQGGDSGDGANNAISLLSILAGPSTGATQDTCAIVRSAKPFVVINEVTTVASIYAMQQFFNPATESLGSSATNLAGLTNAVNTAGSILNLSTGSVNSTYQPYGALNLTGTAHLNITATPELSKIYLIADILAACVNSTASNSTACTALFNDAVPPPVPAATALGSSATFPVATDTLVAAYYLATNPLNATTAGVADSAKMTELYGLATAQSPFPAVASQPTDWTIGLTYSSSVINSSAYVLSAPSNLSIDATGNVWFISSTAAGVQAISVLNPFGGLTTTGVSSFAPFQGLALDSSSNGYLARTSSTKNTYSLILGSSSFTNKGATLEDATTTVLTGSTFAGDSTNMFFPEVSTNYIYEASNSAQTGTPFATTVIATTLTPVNNSHPISGLTAASGIAVDTASHIWVAGTSNNTLYEMSYPAYPVTTSTATTPTSFASGAFNAPAAIAVDHANNVWVVNGVGGSPANGFLTEVPSATSIPAADPTANHGGINSPSSVALDGAGNIWVASSGQTTAFTGQTVSELALVSGTLTAFSPSVGFAHTYTGPGSIAIDGSGNVWVANTAGVATATVPGSITEILGAAVPVVTPIALGVKNSKLASLP